jgi:hypothetical protein
VGGSARITITWPDNWIENQWLQVTVKAAPRTGLKSPDTFYFGNAMGESGNSNTIAVVNTLDGVATHNASFLIPNLASITTPADYDRDGLVNTSDEWITIQNNGFVLPLIAPPIPARMCRVRWRR